MLRDDDKKESKIVRRHFKNKPSAKFNKDKTDYVTTEKETSLCLVP